MRTEKPKLTPERALDASALIQAQVKTSPNPFNLEASFLTDLGSRHDSLADAVAAQSSAEAKYHESVRAKDDALRLLQLDLSAAAKTALASGASDGQLASIGMARPAKPVRPTAIPAPTGLVAQALPESTVRLAWNRGTNPQGTTFEVSWSPDGVAYTIVETTTKASLTLSGYTPGVAGWFQVRAKRSGLASVPSNAATVYATSSKVQLKLAS